MLREERLKLILDFVNSNGYCSNEDISKALNIPFTTLRRDLTDLNDECKLKRVNGGAQSIKERSILELKLDEKLTANVEAKKTIAKKALHCIKPGETIFLDAGSSTYYLAQLINPQLNIRIYTNSVINAQVLANNGVTDIYLLPGKLKLTTGAICGVETISAIKKYNFDVAFIGVNAVDNEFNFYTTDDDEAEVKKTIILNSQFAFGLADTSKMKSKSFIKFSDKSQIALINEEV
ncbi:DeoR/GlpR family DNA-binding transcription regulator [Spiroplasma culicicola]|uniref:DeoR family transcriptional regulator n=1 Tax=Spiroplasma culicicola AES-1 TaxID=1276246 RepID=W6A7J8_9MOLU|nr:DeoR/GlpR family DNA-binding transcription regulator [Spiroplasma culicicola]AHI52825.1 DeoR family transcriptional regulator [Spiroplasma culicicola AES-1]